MSSPKEPMGPPPKRVKLSDDIPNLDGCNESKELDESRPPKPPAKDLTPSPPAEPRFIEGAEDYNRHIRAGITAYVSPNTPGFTGTLKQRFTDFVVNEITLRGDVVHLRNTYIPKHVPSPAKNAKPETSAPKSTYLSSLGYSSSDLNKIAEDSESIAESSKASLQEYIGGAEELKASNTNGDHVSSNGNDATNDGGNATNDGSTPTEPPEVAPDDLAQLKEIFGEKQASDLVKLYAKALAHPERKSKDFDMVASVEPIEDKQKRTEAHQLVRRLFGQRIETSIDDNYIIASVLPPATKWAGKASSASSTSSRGKLDWDELGGEYLHLTLYKENKDTMEVIYFIGSELKQGTKNFGFAGTKDKRACTTQRISIKRIKIEQLAKVQRKLKNAWIGDFTYEQSELNLGHLRGNEFLITLRDCHFEGEDRSKPFFLLDHAGKVVHRAVDDLARGGFINYFGLQRFGSFAASTDAVGIKMLQGDYEGAVADILQFAPTALAAAQDPSSAEMISTDDKNRALALDTWLANRDAKTALQTLPGKFTAEKSIIRHLSQKDRNTGLMKLKDYQGALRNIPYNLRTMYVHAYQSKVWNMAATTRWSTYGATVIEGDLVIVGEHKEKDTLSLLPDNIDADGEVIIRPQDTGDVATSSEDIYARARPLTKEEAASGRYSIFDIVLPLPGFDIVYPPNAIGEYYKTFMGSSAGGGLSPHGMVRQWKDISLSGTYRKVLSRPEAMSFEIRGYIEEHEKFVMTDGDRIKGETKPDTTVQVSQIRPEEMQEDTKIAVIIKMQLGSSTYATIALRELMKEFGLKPFKPAFGTGR